MRVFVTGATGVLGRRVVPLLIGHGHTVSAVARARAEELRGVGATPVDVDLFDRDRLRAVVDGHDAVLDLATRIPPTSRMALPWAWRDNDRLRSIAAGHAADAAIAAGARYVRESLGLLYADAGSRWIGEGAPIAPVRANRTALDAEAAAARVTAAGGDGVVLRFADFYGTDSGHSRDQVAMAERGIATVLGRPDAYWSRIHLDDAASAIVAALDAPAGTYNVVDDQPRPRGEQVAILADAVGRRLRTPPAALGRHGSAHAVARSLRLSNRRFRDATGWAPAHPSVTEAWPDVIAAIRVREPR